MSSGIFKATFLATCHLWGTESLGEGCQGTPCPRLRLYPHCQSQELYLSAGRSPNSVTTGWACPRVGDTCESRACAAAWPPCSRARWHRRCSGTAAERTEAPGLPASLQKARLHPHLCRSEEARPAGFSESPLPCSDDPITVSLRLSDAEMSLVPCLVWSVKQLLQTKAELRRSWKT